MPQFINFPQKSKDGSFHVHLKFPPDAIEALQDLARDVGQNDFCKIIEMALSLLHEHADESEPWMKDHRDLYDE